MKTRLRSLRALREKILSDLQGSPVAVLKNTSPYLRKEALRLSFFCSREDLSCKPVPPADQAAAFSWRFSVLRPAWNQVCLPSACTRTDPGSESGAGQGQCDCWLRMPAVLCLHGKLLCFKFCRNGSIVPWQNNREQSPTCPTTHWWSRPKREPVAP